MTYDQPRPGAGVNPLSTGLLTGWETGAGSGRLVGMKEITKSAALIAAASGIVFGVLTP